MTSSCHELRRKSNNALIAWLQARPSYCDRGHWTQGIEVQIWKSDMDQNPRYYFDLDAAKAETIAYLVAKKVYIEDTEWVEASY